MRGSLRLYFSFISFIFIVLLLSTSALAQSSPTKVPVIVQPSLTAPDSTPFHMRSNLTEGRQHDAVGTVEIYWVSPLKWRRMIKTDEFTQTLTVNGDKIIEEDSDDYIPIGIRTLAQSMVNPTPLLDAHRPSDVLLTKANGASDESGVTCFDPDRKMCAREKFGLTETVGVPGYRVSFTKYQTFGGKRVARVLDFMVGVGEMMSADVTKLELLKSVDEKLFEVESVQGSSDFIRTVSVAEDDFRKSLIEPREIIWPQPLDGAMKGTSTYLVSVDRHGQVREVLPVKTANERTNDSVRRQIMRWKVKPVTENGRAVQAETLLTFEMDARAFGPAEPLANDEVRKLVVESVEPQFMGKHVPAGATFKYWIAVDHEGKLIEAIAAGGAREMSLPCLQALYKWKFRPLMQNGEPRPYRGEIIFRAE